MTTQPSAASVPPNNEMSHSSADDGMSVAAADAEADARRSGADDTDERPSNVGEGFLLWTSIAARGPTEASPWAARTRRPTG